MSESKKHVQSKFWKQQSPINLAKSDSVHVKYPKSFLKFDYQDAPFTGHIEGEHGHENFVLDKVHSGKNLPLLKLGDVKAELVKIHLHTKSEHNLEGKDLDGEIHLIHEIVNPTAGSDLLVVGVFFKESKSPIKSNFFSKWATRTSKGPSTKAKEKDVQIDPRKLLPKTNEWYRYEGSLTSEPYSEIVSWLVFVDSIGVGTEDFKKLKKNAHQPERPVQPINRRFVIRNFQ
ncbi:carbonic anhydrase family protein [Gimesia aquarii]|uniref:carbonic anhydrase n=1 Tax=Gimesia aquarii TaxID=2527964 RepID=A0A517VQK9_9PLAN|nr:carbonic anhydrase family protein [Gimesia aquarii]QDT95263.1 Carbonic anhydrase precursor [Gimesia aquarii]